MAGITRTLASGNKAPFLAFGTGTALYKQEAADSVTQAIEAGFIHIDAAQYYHNEESVGKALAKHFANNPRESLFVTTKFFDVDIGPNNSRVSIKDVLKQQLKHLQVDYVDLYLVHSPVFFIGLNGGLSELWKQVEEVKRDGLAKDIGVSNFRADDLNELLTTITARSDGILPAVNQIEFHPYVLDKALPIIEVLQKHGIVLGSYAGLTPVNRKKDGPVTPVLEAIVKGWSQQGKEGNTGHVLTKWLYAKGAIVTTTSNKKSRLVDTLRVSELPDLTEEEVKAIDQAGLQLHHRVFAQHMDQNPVPFDPARPKKI